ncbi:MAG TPA: DUF1844 domain-containing protein [Pyrinomonadaceae bacterium]|nr:DUF1844 domain-containing protein [Pyrinomonadaceae bacterium]
MIGHDDENEKVHFKVADRRKFNADGTLREGVVLDREPEPKPAAPTKPELEATTEPTRLETQTEQAESHGALDANDESFDEDAEIPGAEDPASFVNFLSTLATNAAASLGAMPHPATGKRSLDLESAKYWLDVLGMLRDKTKGNLHPQEARLIEGLLADLRMQYVHLVRATEEKLKAQAATKFSGDDILGKK